MVSGGEKKALNILIQGVEINRSLFFPIRRAQNFFHSFPGHNGCFRSLKGEYMPILRHTFIITLDTHQGHDARVGLWV